ncbi:MAG: hypothetical protein JSV62_16400 [Promethearchaeota archaeon]|nr:MAG: hypothetical protein JSV62_16400 [Candidatus Lokiarchaeota archaeon]
MRKRNFRIKSLMIFLLLLTPFLAVVLSSKDYADVSSGSCDTGHKTLSIALTTNYTGNEVTIPQGETFDLEVTASGQVTGADVWIGYAFWHTDSDSIQLPDTSPFITEDSLVNEWNDGDDYYALFAWEAVTEPMTRTFRITPSASPTTEILTIQVAGKDDLRSNVIAFSITVVAPDNNPPDVTITSPTDNSYVGGSSVPITAIVDDNGGSGVDSVWAEITNATYNEMVILSGTEPNYSGTWDSTSVKDGVYNLIVKADDALGQLNDTEFITINVDNNPPEIFLESIIPNPSNGITTITVLNGSSDIDGNGIRTTISPPTGGDIHLDLNFQGSNIWNNTFTVTQTGTYLVKVNATDIAGNTVVIGPISVIGDLTLPNVVITSPTEGQDVGGIVSISGFAFGTGSKIASIYVNNSIWGDENQAPQIDTATGTQSGSFIFYNKSYIAPGVYWVEVNITDYAGNFNSTVRMFNMTSQDITPPTIFMEVSPDPSNGFTEILVISNEPLIIPPLLNITLPNSTVIYRPMVLIDTNTWRANYTVVNDGLHNIAISYTDLSSNQGYAFKTFMGDITAPTINLIVFPNPSNGLTIIEAYNFTEVVTSIYANISTPSGFIYRTLIYQGSNKWNATFTVTDNWIYVVRVNGTDLAGNVGYASQSITGDVIGPSIVIDGISPNPSNGFTTISVSNSTSDINEDGIRANVTTPSMILLHIELVYQGSNLWTGSFNVTEDGIYTIYVNATDVLGDSTHIGPSIIYGDFSNPIITINSPEIGDLGESPPNFNITIIDYSIDSTWYKIYDGSKWSEITFFTGTTGTINQTIWDSLNNGELIIRFFANDTFGNTGYSDTSFIKGTEPSDDDTELRILITGEQLTIIFIVLGFITIAGVIVALITNERKQQIR